MRSSNKEATAQIAAGNQPIKVICKIKHNKPRKNFPLKKNDNQGIRTANKIMIMYKMNQTDKQIMTLCHIICIISSKIQINMPICGIKSGFLILA